MKQWAILVVVLYVVILVTSSITLYVIACSSRGADAALRAYTHGATWAIVGALALAQVGLLVVPVRVVSGRPAGRGWLLWPVLAALAALLVLAGGMYSAVWEVLEHTKGIGWWQVTAAFVAIGVLWLIWAFLMGFYSGGREPMTFMRRLTRFLIAGSILELLVAVPAHVVARSRTYCCAGMNTFLGLSAGMSVMLLAFGPAAFVLFIRMWAARRVPKPLPKDAEME